MRNAALNVPNEPIANLVRSPSDKVTEDEFAVFVDGKENELRSMIIFEFLPIGFFAINERVQLIDGDLLGFKVPDFRVQQLRTTLASGRQNV
jgi:hypothetical protein